MFNVVHGPATNPQDGDMRVYCVCVDKIVIGVFEKIRQHSQKFAGTQKIVKVAMEDPLYGLEATATATSFRPSSPLDPANVIRMGGERHFLCQNGRPRWISSTGAVVVIRQKDS